MTPSAGTYITCAGTGGSYAMISGTGRFASIASSGLRFQHLDITGDQTNSATTLDFVGSSVANVVIDDVKWHNGYSALGSASSAQIFIKELHADQPGNHQTIYAEFGQSAIIDSRFGSTSTSCTDHCSDNIRGSGHGLVWDGITVVPYKRCSYKLEASNVATSKVVINRWDDEEDDDATDDGDDGLCLSGSSDTNQELLDVIVENSMFLLDGANSGGQVTFAGHRMTARNNLCKRTRPGTNGDGACFWARGASSYFPGQPPGLGDSYRLVGNSCRTAAAGGNEIASQCVKVDTGSDITNLVVKDNVLFDPGNTSTYQTWAFDRWTFPGHDTAPPGYGHANGATSGDGNITMRGSSSPYATDPTGSDPNSWQPTGPGASYVRNQGTATNALSLDTRGAERDGTPDAGAVELDSDFDRVSDIETTARTLRTQG